MSSRWVLKRTIDARLHGVTPLALTLAYRIVDPMAIGITLAASRGPHSWTVHREVMRDGLSADRAPVYAYEPAAKVQLSTQPGTGQSLLVLRAEGGLRWLVTVTTATLAAFLTETYRVCSVEREARIVTEELGAQLAFLQTTDPPGGPK